MKRLRLVDIYTFGLMALFIGMVLHAPLAVFIGSLMPEYADVVKAWKEILLAILSIVAAVLLSREHGWSVLLKNWLVRISLAYILLHFILVAMLWQGLLPTIAGLMIDLRFIVFFLLVYVLFMLSPDTRRLMLRMVAIGAGIVVGFGLLQVTILPDDVLAGIGYGESTIRPFTTIDSNSEFIRINSTLRGPNPLGALMVVYIALALAYLVRRRVTAAGRHLAAVIAGAVGSSIVLFASYSRSAYAAAVASTLAVLAGSVRLSMRLVLAAAAGAIVLGVGGILISSTDWYSNVVLHEDPESTVEKKSNAEHFKSIMNGTRRTLDQPLGAGVGSTGSAPLYDDSASNDVVIENYYLFVAHESGWLGLGLFLTLFIGILRVTWRDRTDWLSLGVFASGIGLALIGLLLPVWADETVALIWWGLAGSALGARSGILRSGYEARTRQ